MKQTRQQSQKRSVPFQKSLLLNLSYGVLLLGISMIVISMIATNRAVRKLSGSLTERVIATTDARLQGFFEPVQIAIEISATRVEAGDFGNWPLENLDRFFMPIVDKLPQISSLMLANSDGEEYMLLLSGGQWGSRHSRPETWGARAVWRDFDTSGDATSRDEETDYDARRRPWFQGAMEEFDRVGEEAPLGDRIFWTNPYIFFTTKEPGITASVAFRGSDNRIWVLGFDVLLTDISVFTANLRVGDYGVVFVLHGRANEPKHVVMLGLPAYPQFDDPQQIASYVLHPPIDLGGPVADFVQSAFGAGLRAGREPTQFTNQGNAWWGAIVRSNIRTTEEVWIGTVVPTSELLRGLPNTTGIVIAATLVVMILAVIRSIRLSRSYGLPMGSLVSASQRMQRLNFHPTTQARSHITEIRLLADTLERMRQALHSHSTVREDVRIARSIRKMSIPAELPRLPGYEIEAWHESSAEVGGDAWDIVDLRSRAESSGVRGSATAALFVYDVSGAGVHSAINGSQLRAAFRSAIRLGVSIEDLPGHLNRLLRADISDKCHARAWIGYLDSDNGDVRSLCFGHEPAVQYSAADRSFHRQSSTSTFLGAADDMVNPEMVSTTLAPGDVVVVASRGVVDTLSPQRDRFSMKKVEEIVEKHHEEDAAAIMSELRNALRAFLGDSEARNDWTLLVVKRTGSAGKC